MARRLIALFPGSLGDLVCVLPALEFLRGKSRHSALEIAVAACLTDLARFIPGVRRVVSLDSGAFSRLFQPLRLAVPELENFFRGADEIYSWFAHGTPQVRGHLEALGCGSVRSFPFYAGQGDVHASRYYGRCVAGGEDLRCPSLPAGRAETQWVSEYWRRQGWSVRTRLLVVHPGSGGRRKRWCNVGFRHVASWWSAQDNSAVLILLGPAEKAEAGQWRDAGVVVENLALPLLVPLLTRAAYYLGNDSGISHLAGAVGSRGVVLFGPTNPSLWRPLGGSLSVMRNGPFRENAPDTAGISLREMPADGVIACLAGWK